MAVATRHKQSRYGKVYIIELGPHQNGNYALSSHSEEITFLDTADYYDFPISIQVKITLLLFRKKNFFIVKLVNKSIVCHKLKKKFFVLYIEFKP